MFQLLGLVWIHTKFGKIGTDEIGDLFKSSLVEDGVNNKYIYNKRRWNNNPYIYCYDARWKAYIFANMGDCLPSFEPSELPDNILDGIDIYLQICLAQSFTIFGERGT